METNTQSNCHTTLMKAKTRDLEIKAACCDNKQNILSRHRSLITTDMCSPVQVCLLLHTIKKTYISSKILKYALIVLNMFTKLRSKGDGKDALLFFILVMLRLVSHS